MTKHRPVIHKKTGNKYFVLHDNVIECTNGREELKYVIYENAHGMKFCREQNEFNEKFENV